MKTSSLCSIAGLALLTAIAAPHARGQGSLIISGSPAPTMRSLEEIYFKVEYLEQRNAELTAKNALLEQHLNLFAAAALEFAWKFSEADPAVNVGARTSLIITRSNQAIVAYPDFTARDLKFTPYPELGGGEAINVDSAGNVGDEPSIASAPGDQLAFSYYDQTNGDLKFARYDWTDWFFTVVDSAGNVGRYTSLAFGPDGQPAISYYDQTNGDLKFARFDGTDWTTETVDSVGNVGGYTSLAFGSDGQPAIAYHHFDDGDLKFARYDAGNASWTLSVADDGNAINVGQYASLAFGADGLPAISCRHNGVGLKFVRFNGTAWERTFVDNTSADTGLDTSLAFEPSGHPAISYYDATNGDLRFARFNGLAWVLSTVDGVGDVGRYTSLAYGPDGQPAISYRGRFGGLKFARKGFFKTGP